MSANGPDESQSVQAYVRHCTKGVLELPIQPGSLRYCIGYWLVVLLEGEGVEGKEVAVVVVEQEGMEEEVGVNAVG